MRKVLSALVFVAASVGTLAHAATICPTTGNTNTDCGYIITINPGGVLSGSPVTGANPYDGSDDALVGVVNNSGSSYTGAIFLSGSGNGGGVFGFDGDGICSYASAAYCSTAPTGYEGPLTTFSGLSANGTSGYVNIAGLADGGATFFSLEGSPASIDLNITTAPEPSSFLLLGSGMAALGTVVRRRLFTSL